MSLIYVAEFLQGTAALLAAARLLSLGVARSQRAMLAFLALNGSALLALNALPLQSDIYFEAFVLYTVLTWVAGFCAVRESFSLSMESYPGIRTAARWTLYATMAASALVSAAITASAWGHGRDGRSGLFYVEIADRSFVFTLAVIVAGLIFFLSRYPLHLPRSTYVSCGLFSAVLFCQAVADLASSLSPQLFSRTADIASALVCATLYGCWALMLRRQQAGSAQGISFESPDEADLLRQLETMNQLLVRVGRR